MKLPPQNVYPHGLAAAPHVLIGAGGAVAAAGATVRSGVGCGVGGCVGAVDGVGVATIGREVSVAEAL